jgi:hypothetical protein
MSLIDFQPHQLSSFIASANTKKILEVNSKDKTPSDSDRKHKSFKDYLSDEEEK